MQKRLVQFKIVASVKRVLYSNPKEADEFIEDALTFYDACPDQVTKKVNSKLGCLLMALYHLRLQEYETSSAYLKKALKSGVCTPGDIFLLRSCSALHHLCTDNLPSAVYCLEQAIQYSGNRLLFVEPVEDDKALDVIKAMYFWSVGNKKNAVSSLNRARTRLIRLL